MVFCSIIMLVCTSFFYCSRITTYSKFFLLMVVMAMFMISIIMTMPRDLHPLDHAGGHEIPCHVNVRALQWISCQCRQ